MSARTPALILLILSLAFATSTSRPASGQDKDLPKEKEKPKDQDKEKIPKFEWPTQIDGKGVQDWLKDATENPDPAIRDGALKTLPAFGPKARKECSKRLLQRMTAEPDPGVRLTVINIAATIGLEDVDLPDAITRLANVVDIARDGSLSRIRAIETLAMFGPKAERAVGKLIGHACEDPAYETRRMIARCLAQVGYNEKTGPNVKALNRLAATLAKDQCAAVRMEALQALVALGPPWADKSPGKGVPGPVDWKAATFIAERMKERLGLTKSRGIIEHDKQLDIWCRIVLMRFDQKELEKEDHLNAITKNFDSMNQSDLGAKIQALQALSLFGERAGTQVDKVVPLLSDGEVVIVVAALTTLRAMGIKGQPALDQLEKTEKYWADKLNKRKEDVEFKKVVAKLSPEDLKLVVGSLPEEQMRLAVANTIKFIKDSKPGKPGGDMAAAAPAPAPGGEKK